jgi:hypothetical protein
MSRGRLAFGFLLGLLLVPLGCGGTPPPPPAALAATPAKAEASPPPDTSPVARPEGLVLFACLTKPEATLKVVGHWTGIPMPGSEVVGELMTGASIGNVVDLTLPIDVAVAMAGDPRAPRPLIAVSAAVPSLEDAKAALSERYKLVPIANGGLRIEGPKDEDEGEQHPCDLVPAAGGATRLVCGDGQAALEALEPWLARSAPRQSFSEDLHIEARLSPMRQTVRAMLPAVAQIALDARGAPPALGEAIDAAVGDLADLTNDLDQVTMNVNLSDPGANASVTATFGGATSLLARLAMQAGAAEAPPAAFWRLPVNADVAYFTRGADAKAIAHARQLLQGVFDAALEKRGMSDADRKAIVDPVMRYLDLYTGPIVYAKGLDLAAVDKAQAAAAAAKEADRAKAERGVVQSLAGWSVVGTGEAPANVVKLAKDFAAAMARPGVAKWAKGAHLARPPTAKVAPYKTKDLPGDVTRVEITFHEEQAAAGPRVVNMLIVPDGARSWLVLAPALDLAVAKAKALLPNAPDDATLGKRAELDALHGARATSGGFVTARGLLTPSPFRYILGEAKTPHGAPFGGLGGTPGREATPVTFFTTSEPSGHSGAWTATAKVPKDAIQDLVKVAMQRH